MADPVISNHRGFRIERRDNARGTNLVDKKQRVIVISHPSGFRQLLTRASSMNGKPATRCADEELVGAIIGDESVFD